ncbi:MAG: tetratricopeptide repeat protein [Ignavibacteriaceae bacterium]
MLTKKKRLSRKEIKEDKFVETYYKAYGYFEENKSRIGIYVAAIVIVAAAVYFYINNKNSQNDEAGAQLARVMVLYDNGSYLEAIEGRAGTPIMGLKKIVDEYGSTESGEIAKVYLANSYVMLGRLDDALKYYEDYSGGNKLFEAAALSGEAGYYASKNEYEKAAGLYLKASRVSEENVLNPEYMLKAGINYINAGNKEKAKELLEDIRDNYNTSAAFREVDKHLAQLE